MRDYDSSNQKEKHTRTDSLSVSDFLFLAQIEEEWENEMIGNYSTHDDVYEKEIEILMNQQKEKK